MRINIMVEVELGHINTVWRLSQIQDKEFFIKLLRNNAIQRPRRPKHNNIRLIMEIPQKFHIVTHQAVAHSSITGIQIHSSAI